MLPVGKVLWWTEVILVVGLRWIVFTILHCLASCSAVRGGVDGRSLVDQVVEILSSTVIPVSLCHIFSSHFRIARDTGSASFRGRTLPLVSLPFVPRYNYHMTFPLTLPTFLIRLPIDIVPPRSQTLVPLLL